LVAPLGLGGQVVGINGLAAEVNIACQAPLRMATRVNRGNIESEFNRW